MPTGSPLSLHRAAAGVASALLLLGRVAAAQGIVLDVNAALIPSPFAGLPGSPPPAPVSCAQALSLPGVAAFTLHRDCVLFVFGSDAAAGMTVTASRTLLTVEVSAFVTGSSIAGGAGTVNAHGRIDDLVSITALPGATPAANVVFTGFLTGDVFAVSGVSGPHNPGPTAGAGTTYELTVGGVGTSYGITAISQPPLPGQHETFGSLVVQVPFSSFAGGAAVPLRMDLSAGGFGVDPFWSAGTGPGPAGEGVVAGLTSVRLLDAAGNDVTDEYRVRTTLYDISAGAPLAVVPEPGTALLVGSGVLAVALVARRRSTPRAGRRARTDVGSHAA